MLLPPPRTPDTEPTLTMRPRPLALSRGWQARTVAKAPRRLTASTKSKKSSSRARRSACGITRVLPALLTRMSSRPSVLPIVAARLSIAGVSCAGVWLARWPVPGRLAISPSAAAASLAKVTTTRAPSSAKRRAVEAPRPLLPPVTSATLPSSMAIANGARSIGRGGERRAQSLHELDQVGLPQLGIVMTKVSVGVGSGRDQHISAVANPLHCALDGAELGRVRMVLGVVDQQHLGLDLVEIGLGVVVHDRLDRPQRVVGITLRGLGQPALVKGIGGAEGRRHFLNAGRALGAEITGGGVDVVARIGFVEPVIPVRVVADRLGLGAAAEPVAAADLDRLARERHNPVHQVGIGLSPQPAMHTAHRAADHQPQMADAEPLGDKAVTAVNHVAIAVMREVALQPVRRFRGAAAADRVLHDDEIVARVERLAGAVEVVGEARPQPVLASAGIALQQQHAVDDLPRRVPARHAHRPVVQLEFGQHLTAGKAVVLQDEVALVEVRPAFGVIRHYWVSSLSFRHPRACPGDPRGWPGQARP